MASKLHGYSLPIVSILHSSKTRAAVQEPANLDLECRKNAANSLRQRGFVTSQIVPHMSVFKYDT